MLGTRIEITGLRADGTEFPVELAITPIELDGDPLFTAYLRDITERKRTEAALRESESLYRRAVEAADAVPYYIDYATESYRFIGEGIVHLTGHSAADISPAQLAALQEENVLLDQTHMSKAEAVRHARSGALPIWRMDSRVRTNDGEVHWIADSAVQVRDEQGQIVGAIGIVQDITERKHAEEALRRSNDLMQAISRAQSKFISDAGPTTLFDEILADVLALTGSEYGFVGEVLHTDAGDPYLRTYAITDIAWNQESRALYAQHAPTMEFHNLKTLFGAVMTTSQPVFANDPATDHAVVACLLAIQG